MGGWGKGITGTSAFNKSCFIACSPHGPSTDHPPLSGSQSSGGVYSSHFLSQDCLFKGWVPGTGYTGNLLLAQQPKMCGRGETAHLLQCIISLDIWPKKPTHVARWWQKGKLVGLVAGSSFCMWMDKQRVGFSLEGVEPLLGGEKCCLGSQNLSVLSPSSARSNLLPTSSKVSSESSQSRSLHGEQLCFYFNCLTTFA